MDVKVISQDKKQGKVQFLIKGSNPAFVNAMRRNIINEVPTMAIEDVEFRKNNSILYDEIVAHRLGLIPLKTDLKSYNLPEKCTCKGEGCAKCTLKLTLKAKGPGVVLASQIKSKDPKVVPVHPDMPIVKLLKDQQIEMEATAMLGKGKEHMKWSPGLAFFKYLPVIEISKNVKNAEKVVESCPRKVFELKAKKLSVKKGKEFDCDLCDTCAEVSEGTIKLNQKDTDFVFYLESWGQLSPKEILNQAVEIFQEQMDEIAKKLKKK
jgi:DNA-directed RNA polymerase subunit D